MWNYAERDPEGGCLKYSATAKYLFDKQEDQPCHSQDKTRESRHEKSSFIR